LKAKEVNIFNYLNQIFYKTDKHEYDKKLAPAYMLSMWLSHDSKLIDIVNKLNSLQFSLKDDIIYKYYMSKVPKGKRFLKWSKKTPKDKKFDKDVANEMDNNKHLSKREAMMVTKMRGVLNDE
jgi:hypothetical protein